MEIEAKAQRLNEFFNGCEGIELIERFKLSGSPPKLRGGIQVQNSRGNLTWKVDVPTSYPLGEIKFYPVGPKGYPHQNYSGDICLNTALNSNLSERLTDEVKKLQEWTEKYYVNGEYDEFYEYPAFEKEDVTLFFAENEGSCDSNRFRAKDFDFFFYEPIDDKKKNEVVFVARGLGNLKSNLSTPPENGKRFKSVWVKLRSEPLVSRKLKMEVWDQLKPLLPSGFADFFRGFVENTPGYGLPLNYYLIMAGYELRSPSGSCEVHWDLILLPAAHFHGIRTKKHPNSLNSYKEKIVWGKTWNISYDRFFGRGKLHSEFTDKKLLVIGLGAVGSILATALVRGGCMKLEICDKDVVEPGNVCRSEYLFAHSVSNKAAALKTHLMAISPFIQVGEFRPIAYTHRGLPNFEEIRSKLLKFDCIFDCTSDMELSVTLDELQLPLPIMNLSISDKAHELVWIAGVSAITDLKKAIFNEVLGHGGYVPTFREGVGCWHPTFEAAYTDIAMLLNFALKEVNLRLSRNLGLSPFIVRTSSDFPMKVWIDYDLKVPPSTT